MNVAHMVMLLVIASAAFAGRDASLPTVLTPDGRIMEGASGSFDPDGFCMTYGPDGEPLFVAEAFPSGEPAPFPGQYDGGTWYTLGSGVNDRVYAIAVSGSDLYVGGWFTQAGGSPANYIARWDGSSWHSLGAGVNHIVAAIAVSGSDVYVGGYFTAAGGSPAGYIARWRDPEVGIDATLEEIPVSPHAFLHASPNPTSTGTELSFQSIGLSPLTLEIYDTAGRLVRTEALGTLPAGSQAHYWNGLGGNGQVLAQGVYFVRLSSAELEASTRVVLLR